MAFLKILNHNRNKISQTALNGSFEAAGAVNSFVSNIIGSGISPRWQIEDMDPKQQIQELWVNSTEELYATKLTDFYGLEAMVAHSVIESGDVLVRFRPRLPQYGYAYPCSFRF